MKKKKLIIIGASIILVLALLIVIFVLSSKKVKLDEIPEEERYDGFIDLMNLENSKVKDNVKYNTSKKLKSEHKYELYSFSDAKLYSKDGGSYFEFIITNLAYDREAICYNVHIRFLDSEGNIIHRASFDIPNIKIGESEKIVIDEIALDIVNAYDYEVYGF